MKEKLKNLSVAVRLVIVGIVIFAIAYPLVVGVVGHIWNGSRRGSLVEYGDQVIGSKLIGQDFDDPRYFHGRPSSINYDARGSGSKNLSPQNPELAERVENILEKISEGAENLEVPSDLVTESGSALDPHITVDAAVTQVPRISRNTGISETKLKDLVERHTEGPLLGIYGSERVNVLLLNVDVKRLMEGVDVGG